MQRLLYWIETHKLMSFLVAFGAGAVIILYLRSRNGPTADQQGGTVGTVGTSGDTDPYGQGGTTFFFQFLAPNPTGGGVTGPQTPAGNVGGPGAPTPTSQPPAPGAATPVTPATGTPVGQTIGTAASRAAAASAAARADANRALSYQPPPAGQELGTLLRQRPTPSVGRSATPTAMRGSNRYQ